VVLYFPFESKSGRPANVREHILEEELTGGKSRLGGSLGQLPLQTSVAPLFDAHGSRN